MNNRLNEVVNDESFIKLRERLQNKDNNIFSIVGTTETEHWHSSFYKWILSPKGSHGFGSLPLKKFVELYNNKAKEGLSIDDSDLDKMVFEVEKPVDGQKIDIYGESDKCIIVIENKVNSSENFNGRDRGQTVDYYNYIEKNRGNKKAIYIYLTYEFKNPDCSEFVIVTYSDFYEKILKGLLTYECHDEVADFLLKQYINNLRSLGIVIDDDLIEDLWEKYEGEITDIHDSCINKDKDDSEKRELVTIYNKIENKEVFDEIFKKHLGVPRKRGMASPQELFDAGYLKDGVNMTWRYKGNILYAQICVVDNVAKIALIKSIDEKGKEIPYKDSKGEYIFCENTSRAGVKSRNLCCEENHYDKPSQTHDGKGWDIYPTVEDVVVKCKYEDLDEIYNRNMELTIDNLRAINPGIEEIQDVNVNRIVRAYIKKTSH